MSVAIFQKQRRAASKNRLTPPAPTPVPGMTDRISHKLVTTGNSVNSLLLANRQLVDAVDDFEHQSLPISRNNVLFLSKLLSVKGILVPEISRGAYVRRRRIRDH